MGNEIHGIKLSEELQRELCEEAGWEYNQNRIYGFRYSPGGILLSESTREEEKIDEVLIANRERPVDTGEPFLTATVVSMRSGNQKIKLSLLAAGTAAAVLAGVLLILLYLL